LIWPEVGAVTCDMILSNVLFPAPFRPMMPSTSPSSSSKLTSARAQKCSPNRRARCSSPTVRSGSGLPRTFAHQRLRSSTSIPPPSTPSRYCLLRCSTEIAVATGLVLYTVSMNVRSTCEKSINPT